MEKMICSMDCCHYWLLRIRMDDRRLYWSQLHDTWFSGNI